MNPRPYLQLSHESDKATENQVQCGLLMTFFILDTGRPGKKLLVEQTPEFEESLAYRTLADCRPFHPVQAECFQGTGVCLNCSTHTSTPRSDEASESHAIGLDQT